MKNYLKNWRNVIVINKIVKQEQNEPNQIFFEFSIPRWNFLCRWMINWKKNWWNIVFLRLVSYENERLT